MSAMNRGDREHLQDRITAAVEMLGHAKAAPESLHYAAGYATCVFEAVGDLLAELDRIDDEAAEPVPAERLGWIERGVGAAAWTINDDGSRISRVDEDHLVPAVVGALARLRQAQSAMSGQTPADLDRKRAVFFINELATRGVKIVVEHVKVAGRAAE